MHVGVYIDGFNLYYGGRSHARGAAGWKWLDIRGLVLSVAQRHWQGAIDLDRIVYCTARIDATTNPTGRRDQDVYLLALRRSRSVDWIEYGKFYDKAKTRPLARKGPAPYYKPVVVAANSPVMVQDARGVDVPGARFMVTISDREEKGSDVNVASHLLLDALTQPPTIDAAIVVSNDSDLAFPIKEARKRLVVGVVNPQAGRTAGSLRQLDAASVAGQWNAQLDLADFTAHQLPDPCQGYAKPVDW